VADIGGGSALVKWLGASYALAMGTLLVVGGRLGDRYGQRRIFLIGMTGFTLASAVCGLALNPVMLIAARILQGGLGALMIPQGIAIMTKTFPRDMLAKAFAAFGPLLGLSSIAGPVAAGFLIDANLAGLGWRPVFLINIVLGGAGLLAAIRLLPRVDAAPATRVDLGGSVLLGGSVFSLLYGLIQGSGEGWSAVPIACIGVAVLLFAGFCWRQSTASEPLIKPTLLANRGFTSGLIVGLVFFAGLSGLVYVISLFLQTGLRYTPAHASLALLPMMVGLVLAAAVCMGLIGRLGRVLVVIGLLVAQPSPSVHLGALSLVAQLLVPVHRPALRRQVEKIPQRLEGADASVVLSRVGWCVGELRSPEMANCLALPVKYIEHLSLPSVLVLTEVVAVIRVAGRGEQS
jgi:MFS family permease